eukprot:NODE_8034_length_1528_cov_13.964311.p1 GENE.NODE_8034_length_1528_cov_13.964311~~NODE_8034_length_1528_cov_13.964311.p1  ORF type:complete len:272 (+),score=59.16 NODE_8034_length_1528_cov_13.964311:75-890(+)
MDSDASDVYDEFSCTACNKRREHDPQLQRVQKLLRAELGRAVVRELRGVTQTSKFHEETINVTRATQKAWDKITPEVVRSVAEFHLLEPLGFPKEAIDRFEERHRKLGKLSREADRAEHDFAWSRALYTREREYLDSLRPLLPNPRNKNTIVWDLRPDQLSNLVKNTFDPVAYEEDLKAAATMQALLDDQGMQRNYAAERKALHRRLREATRQRSAAKVQHDAELARVQGQLRALGVHVGPDDQPSPRSVGIVDEEIEFAEFSDDEEVPQT